MNGPPTIQTVGSASPTAGASPTPPANTSVPPAKTREKISPKRFWSVALVAVLGIIAIVLIARWAIERATCSITDDAFIEAHIVNIAPQSVAGHLVRYLVEENDTVERGQLLAEIDPVPYGDQVELARSKLDGAQVELQRQEAALDRLKQEVPIQIEIARRTHA